VIALILGAAIGTAAPTALAAATSPSCGQSASTNGRQTTTRSAALKVLVPSGADELLVCRYRSLSTAQHAGASAGVIGSGLTRSAAEISQITRGLDAIQADRHIACPMYELLGSETVAFSYRSGPSVILSVEQGGCSDISNGHITRMGLDTPAPAEIQALIQPVRAGS